MNYKLAFVYNLLRIISRKPVIKPAIIKVEPPKMPLIIREEDEPKLFNKKHRKYDYP